MTEENWSGAAGMAYMNSHFSMASDDTESTAAHELGHMLGAVIVNFIDDIIKMLIIFIIRI
jgi:hypothetical protein